MNNAEKLELMKQREKQRKEYQKNYMKKYYQEKKENWKQYKENRGYGTDVFREMTRLKREANKEQNSKTYIREINYGRYRRAKLAGKDSFTMFDGSLCSVLDYGKSLRPCTRKTVEGVSSN